MSSMKKKIKKRKVFIVAEKNQMDLVKHKKKTVHTETKYMTINIKHDQSKYKGNFCQNEP